MKAFPYTDQTASLMPLPVAVDLIRFEKNLLQMGFFGAHDTRHRSLSTRRIEQWVNREGQKIRVAAEFRGSQELGLPSTSDRDKYIAFMKIAMEQRAKLGGRIQNPIRFTGYHLLKELGLSYSGENYEDINKWGQRMADTTITSEQVIYLAARKKYANKTVHVFRSFVRAGESNLDDTGKAEAYEVTLEDWLLENLNQSYVVPEDFNAYRKLTRPTGKGIFGYLHLWFHASHGRPIEKDYAELCVLLNIPAYRHVSKIKDTMGRSLDELTTIGYLSKWDVRPMVSKEGYKLVLEAGAELRHVLSISQRKLAAEACQLDAALTSAQQGAMDTLLANGVLAAKADALVRKHAPEKIEGMVAYATHVFSQNRRRIGNPAGFIVYLVENETAVPTGFDGRREAEEADARVSAAAADRLAEEENYRRFVEEQVDRAVGGQFPAPALKARLRSIVEERRSSDETFASFHPFVQENLAEQLLRNEIRERLPLPGFGEWRESRRQMELFG